MKEYLKTLSEESLMKIIRSWSNALSWYDQQKWKTAPGIMAHALEIASAEVWRRSLTVS